MQKLLLHLNLFKEAVEDKSANVLVKGLIKTALFAIVMLILTVTLAALNLQPTVYSRSVTNPSLNTYIALNATFSLKCTCKNPSIQVASISSVNGHATQFCAGLSFQGNNDPFQERCVAACVASPNDQDGCVCSGMHSRPISALCYYHSTLLNNSLRKFEQLSVFTAGLLSKTNLQNLIDGQANSTVQDFIFVLRSGLDLLNLYVMASRPLTGHDFDLSPMLVEWSLKDDTPTQSGTVRSDVDRVVGYFGYLLDYVVTGVGKIEGHDTIVIPKVNGDGGCLLDPRACDQIKRLLTNRDLQMYASLRQMGITAALSDMLQTGFLVVEASSNWELYYDRCSPQECQYQETVAPSVSLVFLTVLGLIGGLVQTVKHVVSIAVEVADQARLRFGLCKCIMKVEPVHDKPAESIVTVTEEQ
jgi:hypothetical protein